MMVKKEEVLKVGRLIFFFFSFFFASSRNRLILEQSLHLGEIVLVQIVSKFVASHPQIIFKLLARQLHVTSDALHVKEESLPEKKKKKRQYLSVSAPKKVALSIGSHLAVLLGLLVVGGQEDSSGKLARAEEAKPCLACDLLRKKFPIKVLCQHFLSRLRDSAFKKIKERKERKRRKEGRVSNGGRWRWIQVEKSCGNLSELF